MGQAGGAGARGAGQPRGGDQEHGVQRHPGPGGGQEQGAHQGREGQEEAPEDRTHEVARPSIPASPQPASRGRSPVILDVFFDFNDCHDFLM